LEILQQSNNLKHSAYILSICLLLISIGFYACKSTNEGGKPKVVQDEFRSTFHEAIQEKMRDNFDVAAKLFEKCEELRPENDAVQYALSDIYETLGDPVKTLEHAVQAYELDNQNRWYQIRLAELYFEKGDYHKSATYYAISIEEEKNVEVKFKYAEALIYSHQYKKAIAILDEIEVETGISPNLSLTKHDMYLQLDDKKSAEQELKKLIDDDPSNMENRLMVADYFLRTNQQKAAEKIAFEALELAPENGEIRLMLADIAIRKGDLKSCFENLEIGFKDDEVSLSRKVGLIGNLQQYAFEDSDDGRFINQGLDNLYGIIYNEEAQNDTLHAQYGYFLQMQNKPIEAIVQFKKVVKINPDSYESWLQILYSQLSIRDFPDMEKTAADALDLYPSQPTVFLLAGMAAYETEDFELADELLNYGQNLVVEDPGLKAEFQHQKGVRMWKEGKYKMAHQLFAEAKAMDPYNGNIYESKALCFVEQGKIEEALAEAQSALDQAPTNAFFLDLKGVVLFKAGDFTKARKLIENALVYEPSNPVILEHLGDALYQAGEKKLAVEMWQLAKDNGGYNAVLLKKLNDQAYYEEQ
jgi:tetratricopeptide (TPR) repeat protein